MSDRNLADPIAIVGIGCRFPGGAVSPAAFWRLLKDGVDAIGPMPDGRFAVEGLVHPEPRTPGRMVTALGGFLDAVDRFDAAFFGISPREARKIDPQQRLLLEVAWEALEDAGVVPSSLAGGRTGVYVGLWSGDYEQVMYRDLEDVDLYTTTGGGRYSAAGRISFALDLRGPSMTLDTACSSSLVAVHVGCQALRSGDADLVLAGAANLILQPFVSVGYSRSGMLSPGGHCRFGAPGVDGYVRSEGVAVLALKRLSVAIRDRDPVHAVILGSAVNSDGRGSGSLVAPSDDAQVAMLRAAYAAAGVDPRDVAYVEAHGTGTVRGDHAELSALGELARAGRDVDDPCLTGSAKSNVGHTEASAGLVGLVKTALAMSNGIIPPTLHVTEPNAVLTDDLPVALVRQARPWPERGPRRVAGVSSFGVSGTNVHLVLASTQNSGRARVHTVPPHAYLLPVSARTPDAVAQLACALADRLEHVGSVGELRDVVFSAGARRTHHDHRVAVVGRSRAELVDGLRGYATGRSPASVVASVTAGPAPVREPLRTVFLCDGPGTRWPGLGPAMLVTNPVFLQSMQECDKAMAEEFGWSVLDRLADQPPDVGYDALPLTWATQVGIAAVWRSWGIEPDLVLGRHAGELAAATIRGGLPLGEAAALLAAGGRVPYAAPVSLSEYAEFAGDGRPTLFIELGTGDGLTTALTTALDDAGVPDTAHAIASLPPGVAEPHGMLTGLAEAYVRGAEVDWAVVNAGGQFVSLPGYPWQRRRYWTDSLVGSAAR